MFYENAVNSIFILNLETFSMSKVANCLQL